MCVPGMREGDELIFPRMSEQRPGAIPGDVRLRLRQEAGGSSSSGVTGGGGSGGGSGGGGGGGGDFKRRGDELHVDLRISLKAAAPCTVHPRTHARMHLAPLHRATCSRTWG